MLDERRDCAIKDKRIVMEKKEVWALGHPGAVVCGLAETQIDLVREYLNARKLLSQHCQRVVRGTVVHVDDLVAIAMPVRIGQRLKAFPDIARRIEPNHDHRNVKRCAHASSLLNRAFLAI